MNGQMRTMKRTVGLMAALVWTTTSLSAQQPQYPPAGQPAPPPTQQTTPRAYGPATCPAPGAMNRGGMGMMMHGMMTGMMPGPAMMLNNRQELKLTNAQVARLDSLAAIQERSMERFTPLVMRGMAELTEASTGNIDVNAARAAHNRIAAAHGDMLVTNLEAAKSARETLTPEQRTRWDALLAQNGGPLGMMGMMMHNGQVCPGMQKQPR